jgi:signal transduction histidine kinase/CheY-like chemotaxis protein
VEDPLTESRANLAALLESTRDLVWSVDMDFRLVTFNSALDEHFRRHYGTRASLGASAEVLLPAARVAVWPALYRRALAEGPFQQDYLLPDGRTLQLSLNPVLQEGVPLGISVFGKDISEAKRREEALRASEARYRQIVDNAPLGIYRRSLQGPYDYVSQGLWTQFECADQESFEHGYPGFLPGAVEPGIPQRFLALLRQEGRVQGFEAEVRLLSGRTKWFLFYAFLDPAAPFSFTGFNVEISDAKLAEVERGRILDHLHHSRKMDALGQLAGGVAHDFDPMLGAILGAAELLGQSGAGDAGTRASDLAVITTAANRASELTRKLLAFSRKGHRASTIIDVRKVVEEAVGILKRTLDKRVAITVEGHPALTTVVGDDAMLQNVLLNMGINASHAMAEGGRLRFVLANRELDQEDCSTGAFSIHPGTYLAVDVVDTGCGMSPEVQARIFEPFFTTKAPGQGAGLGLAAAYGTLQDHGGAIQVKSTEGKGSTFRLLLPVSLGAVAGAEPPPEPIRGAGTILVVEDEEILRITTGQMLEGLGYTVLTAANGWEGFEVFQACRGSLDAVLLDMIMPVLGGRQAFDLMRSFDPSVPIILTTGFTQGEALKDLGRNRPMKVLHKPFRLVELSRAVAEAIGTRCPL